MPAMECLRAAGVALMEQVWWPVLAVIDDAAEMMWTTGLSSQPAEERAGCQADRTDCVLVVVQLSALTVSAVVAAP